MASLTALANMYHSDKGTTWLYAHRYTYLYDLIFWPYRNSPIHLLELGLAVGGPESVDGQLERTVASPSVAMWLEYFGQALIYGFDICDFSHIKHKRFTFIRGDSGIESDLNRLARCAPHFDIIIDDASHASFHQQLALKVLWPRIRGGGLYIIEDLHWQSPVYERALPKTPQTRDLLEQWFGSSRYIRNALFSPDELRLLASQVETFSAFPAFNEGADPVYRLPDNSTKLLVIRKGG